MNKKLIITISVAGLLLIGLSIATLTLVTRDKNDPLVFDDCVGGNVSDDGLFVDCPDPVADRDNTPEEEEAVLETGRKLLADLKTIPAEADLALAECDLAEIDRLGDEFADWQSQFNDWYTMVETEEARALYEDINEYLDSENMDDDSRDERDERLAECES